MALSADVSAVRPAMAIRRRRAEASAADEATGQGDEGVVQVEASLPADGQALEVVQE